MKKKKDNKTDYEIASKIIIITILNKSKIKFYFSYFCVCKTLQKASI